MENQTEEEKDIRGMILLFVIFVIAVTLIVAGYQILQQQLKLTNLPLWVQGIIVGLFFLFIYAIRDKAKILINKYLNRK